MKYFILFIFIVVSCLSIEIYTNTGDVQKTRSYDLKPPYNVKMLGDFIKTDVRNYKGTRLGFIQDITIDTKTKEVNYAVLSYNRKNKLFAVPMSALEYDVENDYFLLDMDHSILDHLEGFNEADWPEHADPRLALGTTNYYETEKSWAYTFSKWNDIISTSNYDFELTKLSDLLNYKIESENGEIIGYVNDFVLNKENQIEFIAVFIWDNSVYDIPFKFDFIPFKQLVTENDRSFKVKSRYLKELYTVNYAEYDGLESII